MYLNEKGFTFVTYLDEFGYYIFETLDEFGFYVEFGGTQTFELLAESTSDGLLSLSSNTIASPLATSTSYSEISFTLSAEFIDSLLAESTSDMSLIISIEGLLEALAESTSYGETELNTVSPSTTSLVAESISEIGALGLFNATFNTLAESTSDALISLRAYYTLQPLAESISNALINNIHGDGEVRIDSLLAESVSEALITPMFNITFSVLAESQSDALTSLAILFSTTDPIATSDSYSIVEITPQLVGILGTNFFISGVSDADINIFTYDYIVTDPLTEEGHSVFGELTECGMWVNTPVNGVALTNTATYVFYNSYAGLFVAISSESSAYCKLRYQHFQYPYIIIFDSNYNLVSVEDINTGKFIEVKDNNKFVLDINP